MSDLLNSVVTPRPTSMPASKNERTDNNKGYSSSVWIVIALLTIIFITLQIICVTIALIIGCRKLK